MKETYGIAQDIEVFSAAAFPLANIGGWRYGADGQRQTDTYTGLWWGVDPATGAIMLFTRNNGGPSLIRADDPDQPDWRHLDDLLDIWPDDGLPSSRAAARRDLCEQAAQACAAMAARAEWREPWEEWESWWRAAVEAAGA